MENIKQYHLHKDDYSKLHFELRDAKTYFEQYKVPTTKPHRHSYYQLIWFKSKGQHYIDYQIIEHQENTLFFINKDQIHYFCPNSENDGYLFHFNDFFIERFNEDLMKRFSYSIFTEVGNSYVSLSDVEIKKLEILCSLIFEELGSKDHFHKEQIFSFFQSILFEVERLKKKQCPLGLDDDKNRQIAILFRNLIYQNIDTFLSLNEYCSRLHMNSKKLTEICKLHLNDTPANIIRNIKVLEAKRMLANKNISIQQTAYAIGFDQPTYFTKYFKKATGTTPKKFQTSLR